MAKTVPLHSKDFNPFCELIGLDFQECKDGYSRCSLEVDERLFNPNRVLHGGVVYSMADTGMGGALYSRLDEGELGATIEIKINYFASVTSGLLTCDTKIVHKGRKVAVLESEIKNKERLIAKALGTFSIFKAK